MSFDSSNQSPSSRESSNFRFLVGQESYEARDGVMCAGSVAFPFEGALGAVTVGLRPEHLRFTGSGLSGQVAQVEPMGREILYVADTYVGYLRVLERGSVAVHRVGGPVIIGFSPEGVTMRCDWALFCCK